MLFHFVLFRNIKMCLKLGRDAFSITKHHLFNLHFWFIVFYRSNFTCCFQESHYHPLFTLLTPSLPHHSNQSVYVLLALFPSFPHHFPSQRENLLTPNWVYDRCPRKWSLKGLNYLYVPTESHFLFLIPHQHKKQWLSCLHVLNGSNLCSLSPVSYGHNLH